MQLLCFSPVAAALAMIVLPALALPSPLHRYPTSYNSSYPGADYRYKHHPSNSSHPASSSSPSPYYKPRDHSPSSNETAPDKSTTYYGLADNSTSYYRACWSEDYHIKKVLSFDDIPTNSSAAFTQIGAPGAPLEYHGFLFPQTSQWYLLDCAQFSHTSPYSRACAPDSLQALWSPSTGADTSPVATLQGPPGFVFDVESFYITPVVFGAPVVAPVLRVEGKYAPSVLWAGDGEAPSYERSVEVDERVFVGGLRRRGFYGLSEVAVRVQDEGAAVVFVLDEVVVRVYSRDCGESDD